MRPKKSSSRTSSGKNFNADSLPKQFFSDVQYHQLIEKRSSAKFRERFKNYSMVDLENGTDGEETDWYSSKRLKKTYRNEVSKFVRLFVLGRLITNSFPKFALRLKSRLYAPRIILSRSMAQELLWLLFREYKWRFVEDYFEKEKEDRMTVVKELSDQLQSSFFCMTPDFIESQIYLIHAMVIRPKRQFDDVFKGYFTSLRRFQMEIVMKMVLERNTSVINHVGKRPKPVKFNDDEHYLLNTRLIIGEDTGSNKRIQISSSEALDERIVETIKSSGYKLQMKKYFALKSTDLLIDDGEEGMEQFGTAGSLFNEAFSLVSSPDPDQLIVDLITHKILISPSMCQELCWLYLPILNDRFIRRCQKQLAQTLFTAMACNYTGFSLEDVEQGLAIIIDVIKADRKRGLSVEKSLIDGTRIEIFEPKGRKYRLMKKFHAGRFELCEYLGNGNGSESEVASSISEWLDSQSWSISNVVLSCPTLILEWRRILLTRDWSCLVNAITRSRRQLAFQDNKHKRQLCSNLYRLLMEMIRFAYCDKAGSSDGLICAMRETMRVTPDVKKSDDHYQRILEKAFWFLGKEQSIREARGTLAIDFSLRSLNSPRVVSINTMKSIYEGLLIYYEMVLNGTPIRADNSSKSLTLLQKNLPEFRGVSCLLDSIITILHHLQKQQDAAEEVEVYLEEYPDDLNVPQMAIKRLEPQYGKHFGEKLVEKAPWDPLVVDWSKFKMDRPEGDGNPAVVADRLMQFLDYGTNKNRSDAWELLLKALGAIEGEKQVKTVAEAWQERKAWWKKFHLRKTGVDEKFDKSKNEVLEKLNELSA